jgi:hypothetical protein
MLDRKHITKAGLFSEIIPVYSQNHKDLIRAHCRQYSETLVLKKTVHVQSFKGIRDRDETKN